LKQAQEEIFFMWNIPENLAGVLRRVENPARYTGGEFGLTVKEDAWLKCAVSFPDLYEIGMSNQAAAILYGMLNSLEGVSCERVFCPAEDFENELKNAGLPLYSLETGRPLFSFDILAFTIGYELTATNVLTILDRGGVSPRAADRRSSDPIVIAGGPAITNPLPFAAVFDAVYIGEAEGEFRIIASDLAAMKKKGAGRGDLLSRLKDSVSFWYSGRPAPARRSVWMDFPKLPSFGLLSPVPSLRTVQDHGSVEIMRGCPHGCRFCHASVYYKPFRMKKREKIYEEVYNLIHNQGYREITLSSLSSGDYTDIACLVNTLTRLHRQDRVSFSLPSLHLESLGLSVLGEISAIRKSGLTFAVETPRPELQKGLNKQATRDRIIALLWEAKKSGWKLAKFYFMIGLPVYTDRDEEARDITDFVRAIHTQTRMSLNINIGTFIPKPHTPYQRASQLGEHEALALITNIKRGLSSGFIKVGYHAPFQSYLEGVFSRGDERVGELLFEAWGRGARFDAWDDRSHPEVWRQVLRAADTEAETCRERCRDEDLPWEKAVFLGTQAAYQAGEWDLHTRRELTAPCAPKCPHPCGVCGASVFPVTEEKDAAFGGFGPALPGTPGPSQMREASDYGESGHRLIRRYVCHYEKTGPTAFLAHLSILQVMERALLRAEIALRFTEGFNPKPVLEFAQPSAVGTESFDEVFSFEVFDTDCDMVLEEEVVRSALNTKLPEGLCIKAVSCVSYREKEKKPPSLMSLYAGGRYEISCENEEALHTIHAAFRQSAASPITLIPSGGNAGSRDTLILEHRPSVNGKGFPAALKAILGENLLPEIRVRKRETYFKA
jgi:radical SAM-linked protein